MPHARRPKQPGKTPRNRVQELREFNRLAVGRELHMVELKEEVNTLLQRHGEPSRYDLEFVERNTRTATGVNPDPRAEIMTRIANPKRPNSGMSLAQILLLVGLVVGGLVACITWYVFQLQTRIVETTALDKAQVLSRAVGEFRTIYTAEVVTRLADTGVRVSHDYREHAGAIPLPATLSMLLGSRLGRNRDRGQHQTLQSLSVSLAHQVGWSS